LNSGTRDHPNSYFRMKSVLLFSALVLSSHASEWRLVWSEDFNRAGTPDPAKWTYEKGFVRNQELQFYTDKRRENARVEGGRLVIEARKETFPNPAFKEGTSDWRTARKEAQYTSANLITKGLHAFHYGKIEVRAKLPAGKGVWPAIWLHGNNQGKGRWPMCGEIDIMEFVSHRPGEVHGTIHFAKPGTTTQQKLGGVVRVDDLHAKFHVYGIELSEKTITFLFDGKPYHTVELDAAGSGADNPFRKPGAFYLMLNLAVGGTWGRDPDPKVYPQTFEIDWVKAWEKR
jgi:beta-glucanase (GH16 family)